MNDNKIINLIETTLNEKKLQDINYIRYTFYELKVKYNLTDEELDRFLILIRAKLENESYKVYFTDEKYTYGNAYRKVQSNEILIAINEN